MIWATDTGGYIVGKTVKGPKLAPKISPNKTWSGLLGGMAFSGLVCWGYAFLFGADDWRFAVAGALLAVIEQVGDLIESAIKRHLGIKDSSSLIPGHGGVFDRIDGMIFTAPFVYLILAYWFILNKGRFFIMEWLINAAYYIIPFIVLLGILVFVHEFGHFLIARLCGVQVTDFSIGFGKELWGFTDRHRTKWKICAIPLGGYCQFLGDADAASANSDEAVEELSAEDKKKPSLFKTMEKAGDCVGRSRF